MFWRSFIADCIYKTNQGITTPWKTWATPKLLHKTNKGSPFFGWLHHLIVPSIHPSIHAKGHTAIASPGDLLIQEETCKFSMDKTMIKWYNPYGKMVIFYAMEKLWFSMEKLWLSMEKLWLSMEKWWCSSKTPMKNGDVHWCSSLQPVGVRVSPFCWLRK